MKRIQPEEISGILSEGVICSACELGVTDLFPSKNSQDIIDLSEFACLPGDEFSSVIAWQDTILEIDNKSLTNRPDLWGHYGIARELSAIYKQNLNPLPRMDKKLPYSMIIGDVDTSACQR